MDEQGEETARGRAGEPVDRLAAGGWELAETSTETLFELPRVRVDGHTRVYRDAALGRAVREASGVERVCRFFFATAVEFSPPLSPDVAPLVAPTVAREARRRFADDLRERGFEDVERGHTGTLRVGSETRARLTDYRAVYLLRADDLRVDLRVRGSLASWTDGDFHVAGGIYPEAGLADLLAGADVEPDGNAYREELLDLIRAVA